MYDIKMTRSFTFKNLSKVIHKNKYLNKIRKTTKQDNTSLAYLLKTYKITQRESIRIGYFIEKLLIDIILNETNLINIKESNRKGQKETDHLFFDSNTNTIYYAEIKSNLNLDTEKSKETVSKVRKIVNILKRSYKNCEIKYCIVNTRFLSSSEIPNNIINKYTKFKNHIIGLNDYFKLLNIDKKINYIEYIKILEHYIKKIRNKTIL